MAERCLCTSRDAANCDGGGRPLRADGCDCACHGGAEATDAVAAPEPECTGETARWCPRHGDCTCPPREDWPEERSFDGDDCPLHGERSTHADAGPAERLALEAMEHESVVAEVLRLRAELASVSARASEVPGLSAELDRLRWELAVAMGEKTAGAQCLAEFERMAVESTELLLRKIDTTLALEEAMRVGLEECENLRAQLASVTAERDRLQRACDEGLPREVIPCPACGKPHVEGPRHDDPTKDGRTRPHHTHRCYLCGHVWDAGRWSFGVAPGDENEVTLRLRGEGRAEGLREALSKLEEIGEDYGVATDFRRGFRVAVAVVKGLTEAEVPRG